MSKRSLLMCLLVFLTASPVVADEPVPEIERAISGYIIPNTERFAETGNLLADDMAALCSEATDDALDLARFSFRQAVLGYARIDFLRLGPLETDRRRDSLLFWPDRRSTGLKQVQRVLAQRDTSVLDAESLRQKSVALQGLGALEFVLFGTGSEQLTEQPDGFRCLYGKSIAENIATLGGDIATDWQAHPGFSDVWTFPGPQNTEYRNRLEAIAALVGLISNSLEVNRDQRLKPIAPFGVETKPFKRALFWRSGLTRDMLAASLEGLRDIIQISGLLSALPEDRHWIAGSVTFEFDNAQTALSSLNGPVQKIVEDPELSTKLAYLVVITRSLQNLLGELVAESLGLPTTFSPLDGD